LVGDKCESMLLTGVDILKATPMMMLMMTWFYSGEMYATSANGRYN